MVFKDQSMALQAKDVVQENNKQLKEIKANNLHGRLCDKLRARGSVTVYVLRGIGALLARAFFAAFLAGVFCEVVGGIF